MNHELTQLLDQVGSGDERAREVLVERVYDRLRAIAARQLRGSNAHSLHATALVHEAYEKLFGSERPSFEGRNHFFGAAANAMRQAAVQHARERHAQKRGGDWQRVTLTGLDLSGSNTPGAGEQVEILALDAALDELAHLSQRQARIVELRFFAGLTVDEAAAVLSVSPRTVELDWRTARAWLRDRLAGGEGHA
ncbi:MAG: sigma-70 family RNA polymerase sigma factor [Phycisphaerales bacterium]|nr:sigma-70 family RNA polymerase sigma factor [Phycisphaerales bacterium]